MVEVSSGFDGWCLSNVLPMNGCRFFFWGGALVVVVGLRLIRWGGLGCGCGCPKSRRFSLMEAF